MYTILVQCPEYVAHYLKKKFHVSDGAVLLPQFTLSWYAIANSAQRRPPTEVPHQGNLFVAFHEKSVPLKDLRRQNWLSDKRLRYISKLLRWDFDMNLLEYMEREHYRHGVDYESAARQFHRLYELEGLVSEEALLKKHIRWKKLRKEFRLQAEQMDIEF